MPDTVDPVWHGGLDDSPPRPDVRERIEAVVLSPVAGASFFWLRELPGAVQDFG